MTNGERDRFVPSGVDAQSWLGFEQRIQDRRFRALCEALETALLRGDAVAARVAFEEARELRPDAPELAEMEERILDLPVVRAGDGPFVWSRAVGAVMLLLVGVGLFVGLEWLRQPVTPPAALPAATTGLTAAAPAAPTTPEAPVTIVAPAAADQLIPAAPVETSGVDQQIHTTLDQGRLRPARSVESGAVPTSGETPDDFVWEPERPLRAPAAAPRAASPRFPTGETPDDFVFVPPAAASWPRQSPALPGVAAAVTRP
jgi:hypothetical protein